MERKHSLIRNHETKIECGVRVVVCALVCLFVFLAVTGNIFAQHTGGFYFLASALITAMIMWFMSEFAQKTADAYKSWLILIFIAAFALRLIMLSAWPIEPSSDFKDAYEAALALAKADPEEIRIIMRNDFEYYYNTWSVHMPFVLLQTAIIKIFGEGYYPIQVFFNLFGALSCGIAAQIAKTLYGRRAGIVTGLVMTFLPLSLMFSAVLSNQHIATFFFLLAIYILIMRPIKQRLVNIALASLCTTISQLVRPEMPVFVVMVICYLIYKYILGVKNKRKRKASRRKLIGYCVMFLGIYLILMFSASLLISEAGFVQSNSVQNNYKYKIATGLNAETGGRWNELDESYVNNGPMLDKLISERTDNKLELVPLAAKKIMNQYGTYNYPWCIEGKTGSFVEKWYEPITNGVMLVILLLCLFKVITSIFNKSRREVLLLMAMLGYFLIFMVIEVQNRYNYLMIPLFVILSSGALVHIRGNAKVFLEKLKRKKRLFKH